MKRITTTREYDDQGRLVKETVMETVAPDAPVYYWPTCTCGTSGYCPTHGWRQPTWYCSGGSIGSTTSVVPTNAAALS